MALWSCPRSCSCREQLLHKLEYGLVISIILEVVAIDVGPAKDPTGLDGLADAFFDEARTGRDLITRLTRRLHSVRVIENGTATCWQRGS